MYIRRNLKPRFIARYIWPDVIWTAIYNLCVFTAFFVLQIKWFDMPFELVSTVGIAVSFLIGFKNSQAYDRFWEGRKIWGRIVNTARMWGAQVIALVGLSDPQQGRSPELRAIHRQLIHRHIAWINALRIQLRQTKTWSLKENALVERLVNRHHEDEDLAGAIAPLVSDAELDDLRGRKNMATHLVKNQATQLKALQRDGKLLDGFDLLLLMGVVNDLYDLQGMCERIKNTPFPRQFGHFSKIFTILFCLLLPLGLLDIFEEEFLRGAEFARTFGTRYVAPSYLTVFLLVPLSIVISIVFLMWEQVGDNSEEPFDGRPFDVPMTALCRTIEIDLRDMLDESDLPPAVQPKDDILY